MEELLRPGLLTALVVVLVLRAADDQKTRLDRFSRRYRQQDRSSLGS